MFHKKIKKNSQLSGAILDKLSRVENDKKMMANHLELTRGQPYPLYAFDKNTPTFIIKKICG